MKKQDVQLVLDLTSQVGVPAVKALLDAFDSDEVTTADIERLRREAKSTDEIFAEHGITFEQE
ncbi:hypothetical protein [Halodesulfovibrio aestuarii]|uniref:50S ribosomal protein L7/L12 n=1 Tax=Halodesulfovibrio aestuarii TaxID=126333 RepID=A0ABV4JWD5_9BACT